MPAYPNIEESTQSGMMQSRMPFNVRFVAFEHDAVTRKVTAHFLLKMVDSPLFPCARSKTTGFQTVSFQLEFLISYFRGERNGLSKWLSY